MNCADIKKLLHAYADGELDLANSLELERHLKSCPACSAERESLLSLRTALRQKDLAYRAPNSLRKDIRKMVRISADAGRPRERLWIWKLLTAGATAFAILTIVLRPAGMSDSDQLLNEAVAGHVRSLMADHLTDVLSSDQHTVKPWFNGKIDFTPEVKDFAAQGFPLVGGRLDYLHGRDVAVLVYQRSKHFINVFVWPDRQTGSGKAEIEHLRGYSIINRELNGLHYCFVSDLNAKELGDLASLVGQ